MTAERSKFFDDLIRRSEARGYPTVSAFVSAETLDELTAKYGKRVRRVGGFEEHERGRAVCLPNDDYDIEPREYVRVLEVSVRDGKLYSHRDYLGSLLGLGVERDAVGDIRIVGGKAYVAVSAEIFEYMADSLTRIAGTSCAVSEALPENIQITTGGSEEITVSVMSERVDSVVSETFGLQREKARSLIENGLLKVCGIEIKKPDRRLNEGETFTLRGYGKGVYLGLKAMSKKGRMLVKVRKYL